MALPPIRMDITRYQKRAIYRKKKPCCSTCSSFDIGIICGSCKKNFCKSCVDVRKKSIVLLYLGSGGVCKDERFCGIHSFDNPSERMSDLDLYKHMESQFDAHHCSGKSCTRKEICPDCTIQLQTTFCVECARTHKKTAKDVPHYCSRCLYSRNCLYHINSDRLSTETPNVFAQRESERLVHHDEIYQTCYDVGKLIYLVCGKHYNELN